ncbi:Plasmodium variant antigen protein Cir/Yir/Bir/Plasmodium vivax Vir protein, putative [Plasmodium chabaudi adami]|uniref:Plasmodium variant antigen protein Cir/Yir/Bir/Plasmodium vivax Vir protein, putative n=1 Tax=Plasmodium chabaudi adami TaxID=5826 RepID=A0A1C6WTL6_PLACE|nr:Plasmodium variant antigen protein Cir/Yir/Bir/Plasmodium vivax Vir protein, putative [Plasmodium chabaudi adami]
MSDEQLCELFLDADNFFDGKIVKTNKIVNSSSFQQYCPNWKCKTNKDKIGALSTYLFMKLPQLNNDKHKGYFLMWLSDKLFKMVKDKDKGKENSITLNEAYETYLEKNIGNFKYWNLVYNIRGLKDADLRHMHELYTLLKHICNTIVYYKKNNDKPTKLLQYSVNCLNQYRSLYNSVSGCDSYLYLLGKLKKIYDDFRDNAIKKDTHKKNNIENRLKELIMPNKIDLNVIQKIENSDLSTLGCAKLHSQVAQQKKTQPSSPQGEKKESTELPLLQSSSHISQQKQSDISDQSNEVTEEPFNGENSEDNEQKNETQESSSNSIITSSDHGTETDSFGSLKKEIIPEIASSGDIFNEHKIIVFSVIAIAIPVILAVMYKFLEPVWRKKIKKKNMKKIINLCDEKKVKKEVTNAFIEKNQSE